MKGKIGMEKMRKLFEKVAVNQYLQAKFAAIINEAEEARAETRRKLIAFAKDAGYEVTAEEMQEYFRTLMGQPEGSLTDMELDMVSGGKSTEGSPMLLTSLFTPGLFCAVASIAATAYRSCDSVE